MKNKLYSKGEDERCYSIKSLIKDMKSDGLEKIEIEEVSRDYHSGISYCKKDHEFYEKGYEDYPCGKKCDNYLPRNGKSGCCKHSRFTYSGFGKYFTLHVDGTLEELKKEEEEEK